MQDSEIFISEEIKNDPYDPAHPWSIKVHERPWLNNVLIEQGGHGVRPIYVATGSSHRFIGSVFKEIAESQQELSPDASGRLALLLLGHTVGERTLVREIRRLPPGNTHSISADRISSSWKDMLDDIGTPTVDDVADRFISGFRKRITFDSTGWLPLTGGLDSRTIASVMEDLPGIRAYTRGNKKNGEVKTASRVARIIGLNHRAFPFDDQYLQKRIFEIVSLTGGMVSVDHSHAIHPLKKLKKTELDVVIPGINGEYGRSFWPCDTKKYATLSREDIASLLFQSETITRKNRYANLFTENAIKIKEDLEQEYVQKFVDSARCARFDHPVAWQDEFYLRDRVRTFTAFGGVIWDRFFRLELPFLDPEYVLAVRSLPPEHRIMPEIHIAVIKKNKDSLTQIPLFPSGRYLCGGNMDHPGHALVQSMKRLTGKRRAKSPQDYARWLREESAFFTPIIRRAAQSACGLVHEKEVIRLWKAHLSGKDHHRILCRLMTLVLFDDLFLTAGGVTHDR